MRLRWIPIALLLVSLPALAQTTTQRSPRYRIFTFTASQTGDSDPIQNDCASWQVSYTSGTGGVAKVYAVETSTAAASSGVLLGTYSATSAAATVIQTTYPYLKVDAVTAPSSGTAVLYLYCHLEASSGGSSSASLTQSGILIAGDSAMGGVWTFLVRDEPWAQPNGVHTIIHSGYISRFLTLTGATGQLQQLTTLTSGGFFGPLATTLRSNIPAHLDAHPEITDVFLMISHNDLITGVNCSHGTPFNPSVDASGACSVDDMIANLKYLFDEITARGRTVFWQMPAGWLGKFQDDASPGAATYQDAIQRSLDELLTHCVGKACFPSAALYIEACAGDTGAPDPTTPSNCAANNSVNYGDGLGLTNRLNAGLMFVEDAVYQSRNAAAGASYRVHPSGYGYQAFTRTMANAARTQDPTLGVRHGIFDTTVHWSARPGIPTVTIGTVTATSIQVTPSRASPSFINGSSGTEGECFYADCEFVCWATCVDLGQDSDDPACSIDPDPIVARDIGAPTGAAHIAEDLLWTTAPREVVVLEDGQTGTLTALASATDYKAVCVAVSATAISHPGVRNVTTP